MTERVVIAETWESQDIMDRARAFSAIRAARKCRRVVEVDLSGNTIVFRACIAGIKKLKEVAP